MSDRPCEFGESEVLILKAADMRACDRAAVERGTPSAELMKRAAHALARTVRECAENLPIVFFCGSGNNGGDGYAAALELKREGFSPRILPVGDPERMTEDCRFFAGLARTAGVQTLKGPEQIGEKFLAVDCVFGTGFHGRIDGKWEPAFGAMARAAAVVACDIPSGLDADSGLADPMTVRARETVTFAAAKYGHFLGEGLDLCGKLRVAEIGIPVITPFARLAGREDVRAVFPPRRRNCHKGSFEKIYLVGGSAELQGSVAISALSEAALRSGCGYATVVCPRNIRSVDCLENTFRFCGEDHLVFDESLFAEVSERADLVVAGMGMGESEGARLIVKYLTEHAKKLILDADALNVLAQDMNILEEFAAADRREGRPVHLWLTPHPGEFARLSGRSLEEIAADPAGIAEDFAKRYHVGLLLKGAASFITDGENRYVNACGSPALAKAGSGDALDGFAAVPVARLGTRGLAAASYLAGACARAGAEAGTEHSLLASDLARFLPGVLRNILKE